MGYLKAYLKEQSVSRMSNQYSAGVLDWITVAQPLPTSFKERTLHLSTAALCLLCKLRPYNMHIIQQCPIQLRVLKKIFHTKTVLHI